jgi:hypothetical protein
VTAWRIIAAQTIDARIAELLDEKAGLAARALDGSDDEVGLVDRRPARGARGPADRRARRGGRGRVTEPVLLTQWALCGIAAGAARFLPVPLLDDVVRRRAAQTAVVRTLKAHDRRWSPDLAEPLWAEPDGTRTGLRGRLDTVPGRLLRFPVRKYTALFGAVRGVPNDVARVVLLARAVDRRLERGALSSPERVADEARALRTAVDEAIRGMDLQLLTAGWPTAVEHPRADHGRRGPRAAAARLARGCPAGRRRRAAGRRRRAGDGGAAPARVSALLERFDAQVDDRLARGA